MWPDERTLHVLATTALLVFGTAIVSGPIGTLLAILISRTDLPGRRIFAIAIGVLLVVPLYLQTGAWQAGFGLQGWYTVLSGQPELLHGLSGAIWVHGLVAIPWVALIVAIGLWLVEPELEEDGLLNAAPPRVFLHVSLVRAAGAIGLALLFVAVITACEMTATDLFRVRTYAEEVYLAFALTGDLEASTLRLLPGIVVNALILMVSWYLCLRFMPSREPISVRRHHLFRLHQWRWPLTGLMLLVLVIVVLVPIGNLVYRAGIEVATNPEGQIERSWALEKFLRMTTVEPFRQFGDEFISSLIVGICSASAAIVGGFGLAWLGNRERGYAVLVCALVAVLFAVPGPLLGAALSRVLVYLPLVYSSYAAPSLALAIHILPLTTLILWHALRSIPRDAIDAARVAAGPWQCMFRVAVPLCWPAIVIAWIAAFLLAFGDLSASYLLQVPGKQTLASRVFGRLHSGAYDQVSGLFLALIVFIIGLGTLAFRLLELLRQRKGGAST